MSVVILARLMTPEDIGIFSVSVAIVAIAHQIRDFGIASYIIQEKELTKRRFQSAFGVILVISWVLAALIFLSRHLISEFYHKPEIASVLAIISMNFVLIPFGATLRAVLQRNMMFGKMLIINISGAIAGSLTSIILAYNGFKYMSLAWGSLATITATVLVSFCFKDEITYFVPRFHEWRRVARIGTPMMFINILSTFSAQVPELVIGKVLSFGSVGIYSRARGQINLFNQNILSSITAVSFPLLARKHRDGEPLGEAYLKIITHITGLSFPFYAGLGILCFPVTRVMFGGQWDAAIPLIQILCFAQAIGSISPIHGDFLMVFGRVKLILKAEVFMQLVSILLFVVTIPYGLEYAAASRIPLYLMMVIIYFFLINTLIELKLRDLLVALIPSLKVLLFSIIGPLVVMNLIAVTPGNIWIHFILGGGSLVVGWIIGVFLSNHPLKDELVSVWKYIKKTTDLVWKV